MLIRQLFLLIVGIGSGVAVSAGTFAAIAGIGIVPRFADRTHTAKHVLWYENCAIIGGILGNVIFLYQIKIPGRIIALIVFGLFSGIFVGCMVMALAEILNVIPIFTRRIKVTSGLRFIIISIALGKIIGSWFQFFSGW
ncbi:stage V sporulation protein AB [Candidatus Galacturonibacter soehngenii]|uniref:Stage V sporulation protein AB n=1 Tax=Candidatus Galacturonatibacter soehngenii TaxID=2307010 RepID=A0A7V7QP80_9FIRM|nr:stage V sporulation protein AB [Candidatus Galacturonibacter soehngenii]KAB1440533.1 stage V sporulation protein AB [Candidatus Galacturonibacter soehngenii]